MKIALRIVGVLYLVYDFIHILQIPRLLSLYRQFGAEVPIGNLVLLPLGIFMWGIFILFVSSSTKFNSRMKWVFLLLSIVAPIGFFTYGLVLPIYNLSGQL